MNFRRENYSSITFGVLVNGNSSFLWVNFTVILGIFKVLWISQQNSVWRKNNISGYNAYGYSNTSYTKLDHYGGGTSRLSLMYHIFSMFRVNILEPGTDDVSWMNTPHCHTLKKLKDRQIKRLFHWDIQN